jgi:hypothetical protein
MKIIAAFTILAVAPDGNSVHKRHAKEFSGGDCLADVLCWYAELKPSQGSYSSAGSVIICEAE